MNGTTLSTNAPTGNRLDERLRILQQRIARACQQAGRNSAEVTLLPVSKTVSAARLEEAYALGLKQFGENYLQEALCKIEALPKDIIWHFIGPIQSNKTRAIAEHFHWVHSLDRIKIARRLNEQRPTTMPALNICVQVNISGETSKSGVLPENLPELIEQLKDLKQLQLQGLMCLPLATDDRETQLRSFHQMRELRDNFAPDAPVLSMGMSADLEAAIAEGSTMIRIGSALFGPRPNTPIDPHESGPA